MISPTLNETKSIKFEWNEWFSLHVFVKLIGEKSWADKALGLPTKVR